jgi:5-methyltetrahydropteroyltriglutamate--homocysteine methyltransferase
MKELGLGVVNPRSDEIETPARICERVHAAVECVPAERLFLNPDCGFGTFAARPMNTADVAARKLAAMVEAARSLREGRRGEGTAGRFARRSA